MKPQELRIRNLVNYNGKVVKVEQITKHKIGYHTKPNETRMNYAKLCEIEPIPITEELLLKNGFTHNGKGQFYYHLKDKYKTTIRCATDDYKHWLILVDSMRYHNYIFIDANNDNVQYIHELQNVIQMAKVDKEIEL